MQWYTCLGVHEAVMAAGPRGAWFGAGAPSLGCFRKGCRFWRGKGGLQLPGGAAEQVVRGWAEVAAGGGCAGVQGQGAGGWGGGRCGKKVLAWAILRAGGGVETAVGTLHDCMVSSRRLCGLSSRQHSKMCVHL